MACREQSRQADTGDTTMIVYDGPSMLDGKPILGILTTSSDNQKTGDMAQLWILPKGMLPVSAVNEGADYSVCGNCKMRKFLGGGCYVNVGHGPQGVWKAWGRGKYQDNTGLRADRSLRRSRVRLGAYGDPAALPERVVRAVASWFDGHTGYTHQWRDARFQWLKGLAMASADTLAEYQEAKAGGWRCFRVVADYGAMTGSERECANDSHGTKCVDCMACHGGKGADISIMLHGSVKSRVLGAVAAGQGEAVAVPA